MIKRLFDICVSLCVLVLFSWLLLVSWVFAGIATNSMGVFTQKRVGRYGKLFTIYKLRTLHIDSHKIDTIGRILRKYKLDELPQLFNVLKGDMSFVGPRPDIPGYADLLEGDDRLLLQLKPGLTSEATLKYRNEEALLAAQPDPLHYNDTVLYPDKVRLNRAYYHKQSFWVDVRIILKTAKLLLLRS